MTGKKKKRISTQSAKAKGRGLQQWTCERISKLLDMPWGPDECIASREGSQIGTDVRLVGPAKTEFPYSVECKFQESWAVHSWIDQARSNLMEGTDWIVVAKRSYRDPVVIMDADHFFELRKEIRELREYVKECKNTKLSKS